MEEKPSHSTRRVLTIVLAAMAVISTGGFLMWKSARPNFSSSPSAIRPWAEAGYKKLTIPGSSPGNPFDTAYRGTLGAISIIDVGPASLPSGGSSAPAKQLTFDFESAAESYTRPYKIASFDGTSGLKTEQGEVKIKWLATESHRRIPGRSGETASSLKIFRPDGVTLGRETEAEARAAVKNASGGFGNREMDTHLHGFLSLTGFTNATCKLLEIFDENTHVPLGGTAVSVSGKEGFYFRACLNTLHTPSVLAVFDVRHGEFQEFSTPAAKGSKVEVPEFRWEALEIMDGHSTYEQSRTSSNPKLRTVNLNWPVGTPDTSSLLYQVTPASASESITVEAQDVSGKKISAVTSQGLWSEPDCSLVQFNVAPSAISSLKVRYKPGFTRLLVRMDISQGISTDNLAPADLFDVKIPSITFDDSTEMHYFIANTTQLDRASSHSGYSYTPGFPLTMTDATPRSVAYRYLSLRGSRKIAVDPSAMTIQFDDARTPSLPQRVWNQVRRLVP